MCLKSLSIITGFYNMDIIQLPEIQKKPDDSDSESDVSEVESEGSVVEDGGRQEKFKKCIREWIALDNQIIEYRKEINSRNKRKKQLTPEIIEHMNKINKEFCNLGNNGTLEVKQRKSTTTLKKDYVEKLLTNFLKDEEQARKSAEYIFNNKEVKFVPILKRSLNK